MAAFSVYYTISSIVMDHILYMILVIIIIYCINFEYFLFQREREEEDSEGSLVDFIDDDSTPEVS